MSRGFERSYYIKESGNLFSGSGISASVPLLSASVPLLYYLVLFIRSGSFSYFQSTGGKQVEDESSVVEGNVVESEESNDTEAPVTAPADATRNLSQREDQPEEAPSV